MARIDSTILSPSELRNLLYDSLRDYSEDVAYIGGNNPYEFSINNKKYFIFIHNVHDSGKGRSNPDECRIQINSSENFIAAQSSGKPVIFLGYFPDLNIFTAWNPRMLTERINQKQVVSVYSRFSVMARAKEMGVAVYKDSNDQIIPSFKPEYIGLYLENIDEFHLFEEPTLRKLVEQADMEEQVEEGSVGSVDIEGKKFVVTHARLKRDPHFRKKVLDAYDHRCAICGIQLELVQAAHIIPHSETKGTDEVDNGICLCTLHHDAYDRGLIYINEEYVIELNSSKVSYLEKIKRDGGYRKFVDLQTEERVQLPNSQIYYPSKINLKQANAIRGVVEQ